MKGDESDSPAWYETTRTNTPSKTALVQTGESLRFNILEDDFFIPLAGSRLRLGLI